MLKNMLKWIGIVLGGLLALVVVALGGIYIASEVRVNRVYDVQAERVRIPDDPAVIERGRRLATNLLACVDCHGPQLAGKIFVDDPLLGRAVAANLTRGKGGLGGQFSDTDWVRAIRHGIKPDGTSMFVMPVEDYVNVNEPDLAAVIAYVKSVPPVDNELPASRIGMLGRVLLVTGQANLLSAEMVDQTAPIPPVVAAGPTVEYGHYLARTTGCTGCHGANLSGGRIPGSPPDFPTPPNITPGSPVAGYQDEAIARIIREGRRPDGSMINSFMPYKYYNGMTDEEVRALVLYLRSVPAREFGNR
jgi:mono/diheme cytochrome c family protein